MQLCKNTAVHKKVMFTVLALVYMVSYVQAILMTVVTNDIMLDMNLTPAGMGRLGSFYLYGYAGVMLFSGAITAWLGPRKTLSTLCCVSALGGLLFANADSFAVAAVGRLLCGVGLSSNMTSAFTIFTRWYPANRYARLCALFVALGGIGTFLGSALLPAANAAWGWRAMFQGIALLTLAYGLLVFAFVRDWPSDADAPENAGAAAQKAAATPAAIGRGFLRVARSLDFWRIFLWFFTLAGVFFSFSGLWAMPYLKEVYGMTHGEAGLIASMVSLGYIIGAPAISWFADRVLRSYRVAIGLGGVLTVLASGFLVLRIDAMSVPTIFLLVTAIGMAVNGPTVVAHAAGRNLFGAGMAGIVSGIFGCAAFLGSAFLQIVSGELLYLGQGRGWQPAAAYALAFSPYCLCGLLAAWAGFTLSRGSYVDNAPSEK